MTEKGTRPVTRTRKPAGSPLLRAKLRVPARPEHFVRRQRLVDLLDDLMPVPLALVVAPAGAGKSMLLSDWLEASPAEGAWLSLDEADCDGTQLWTGVVAALETLAPECGGEALKLLQRRRPPAVVAGQLLNDLEARPRSRCVLVLDDVHAIDSDAELVSSLGVFLLHLPVWLHVVLASRHDMGLPVDRLRSRGQLGEIRFDELRFSEEEASGLLAQLAPSLSEEEISDNVSKSDGWAVGLQMAALATRSKLAQPASSEHVGHELLVDDFVRREILESQAPELVDLMLAISVVERVNAGLASALTDRDDAAELLAAAEARGLFVNRLGVGGWYEVHSLVRTALRAELTRRPDRSLAGQHRRAAEWFEERNEVPTALEHWLLAEQHREALRLLAAYNARLGDLGREAVITRTIGAIPPVVTGGDFEALLEYAWCHLMVSRRGFVDAVEQASWWASRSEVDETLRGRLTMLRSIVRMITGDWATSATLAGQAMLELSDHWWRDPLGRFGWNQIARAEALSERWDDSSALVEDAESAMRNDPERRLSFEGIRAVGHALAGRPVDAIQTVAGIRRPAEAANMTILRAEVATAEAIAHRELGDRARAVAELGAIAESPAEATIYCRVLALVELTQAQLDRGDLDAAVIEFKRLRSLLATESFGHGVLQWQARVGVLVSLAQRDIDAAWRFAVQVDDPYWKSVSSARVHLAIGDAVAALAELEKATPRCVRHEVVLGVLRARAHVDHDESLKCATRALELAAANEMLQTIASEGSDALELLERAAWTAPEPWMERLRRLVAGSGERAPLRQRDLIEQLTDREREVLRFLPSRLTVREIADELYVSVNTLKFHLKVIYRKLGVTSRAEAAAKARQLTPR